MKRSSKPPEKVSLRRCSGYGRSCRLHRQDDLDVEQHRCDEEEGEFNRFGNTGEHGGQGCGQEQAAGNLFLFRFCRAVHGKGSAGETEDHEDEFTREVASSIGTEVSDVRRGQLSKEDVLAALDELAVDHHRAADAGLPEAGRRRGAGRKE